MGDRREIAIRFPSSVNNPKPTFHNTIESTSATFHITYTIVIFYTTCIPITLQLSAFSEETRTVFNKLTQNRNMALGGAIIRRILGKLGKIGENRKQVIDFAHLE